MEEANSCTRIGAQGVAEPLGMSSFSAILNQRINNLPAAVFACTTPEYRDMKVLLGCTDDRLPVTQKQLVAFALFLKACIETNGEHMGNCMNYLCKMFTQMSADKEEQALAMDNEYPYKDDQLVSPKVIEEYTGYSDTTVRKQLSEATIKGLIECHRPPILDANGKEQLNKKGEVRRANPRYRWSDVKLVFGSRRREILSQRDKSRLQKARALQQEFS